ncbi:MAG: type II toxin-antitoxin system prevent-host-death family antitoxin [Candidatus Dormibacteraeota bacterium]|nr:type II toxin-antitoxin system prevent-host-death family antitoxin [Candidatus Dormibacteraeota bacterium]
MVYRANVERVQVRELRQNASQVVRAVEEHGPVVVTVNGRDAVLMTPLRRRLRDGAKRSTDGAPPTASPTPGGSCEGPARHLRAPARHAAPRL